MSFFATLKHYGRIPPYSKDRLQKLVHNKIYGTFAASRVFCVALHTLDVSSCKAKICVLIERHVTRASSKFKRNPSTRHYGLAMVTRGGAWVTRLNTLWATPIHKNQQLEMGSPCNIIQLQISITNACHLLDHFQ